MKKEPKLTIHQATAQGMTTLVGFYGPFPRERGNCFSVYVGPIEKKEDYLTAQSFKIINFGAENLEHLLETKVITWPIEISQIDDTYLAKITDKRIPKEFFDAEPCRICTSKKYWTPEQRKQRADDIRSGQLVIGKKFTLEDGTVMRLEKRRCNARTKPLNFTVNKSVEQTDVLDTEGILQIAYGVVTEFPPHKPSWWERTLDSLWFRVTYFIVFLGCVTWAYYQVIKSFQDK